MNKIENVVTPMTRFAAALGYEPSEAQKAALVAYVQGFQLLLAGKAGTGKTWFFKALKIAKLRKIIRPIMRTRIPKSFHSNDGIKSAAEGCTAADLLVRVAVLGFARFGKTFQNLQRINGNAPKAIWTKIEQIIPIEFAALFLQVQGLLHRLEGAVHRRIAPGFIHGAAHFRKACRLLRRRGIIARGIIIAKAIANA